MCQCHYCHRWFRGPQSVKAHLRRCPIYLKSKDGSARMTSPNTPSRAPPLTSSKGTPVPTPPATPSDVVAHLVAQMTAQLAGPDEAMRLKQKRQALLTGLCTTLVDWYHPLEGVVTPEMAVEAKIALLNELGTVAIEVMPQAELTLRGTAIRNRICAPYLRRQQEVVTRQNERQQQDALRRQQESGLRARHAIRKSALLELGITRALQSASSRGFPHRAFVVVEWEVRARLEAWLVGDETESQVEETIAAAIDRPLLEWEARIEQFQGAERQRVLDKCLTVALPIVEAAMPRVKDIVVTYICETLGMPTPPPSPAREASASSTNEAAPESPEAPTPRPVRRRREDPASPPTDRGEVSATEVAPAASSEKWTATS